ncbi:unnamed protein product, partial [Meganyctiphanes norvegica]
GATKPPKPTDIGTKGPKPTDGLTKPPNQTKGPKPTDGATKLPKPTDATKPPKPTNGPNPQKCEELGGKCIPKKSQKKCKGVIEPMGECKGKKTVCCGPKA